MLAAFLLAAAQPAATPEPTEYVVPATRCYANRDIALEYRDGSDNVRIAGSLAIPRNGGRRPTIVMITGSGDHVRDQMISGVPMFGLIADFLARAGYNVVRTDARGFGGATINGRNLESREWLTIQSPSRYRDNQRLLDHLSTLPEVDPERIILLGHSEGAMIASRLAADRPDIDLAILLSNSTAPGNELFATQRTGFAIRDGATPEVASALRRQLLDFVAFLTGDRDNDERFERIVAGFAEAQRGLPEPIFSRDFLQFHRTGSPFHLYLMGYDPYPDLSRIRTPVLAVYGSRDDATPPDVHAPILARALAAAGNSDFAIHVLPDQDHFFLEFEGRRVDRHPFGRTRIASELRDLLLASLATRYVPAGPYCAD